MLKIGSHVSMKGKKMLKGAAEEAASYDATTFMIYTGAPQNTRRKKIEDMNIKAGHDYMDSHGIEVNDIVVHAPYIINLGNVNKPENFEFAVDFMKEEIKRAEALGATQMTMHPGAHVGEGADVAIEQIAKGLNQVLHKDQKIQIALETMAGKGTEIGRTFEEIKAIIDLVDLDEKLSVTLDTCHVHDAGYDLTDFDGLLQEFDHVIGLDRLKVVHINDSKNERGAHKDRHANIGQGFIGFETLNKIVNHPKLEKLPKILETPYVQVGDDKKNKKAPYGHEIQMFKTQTYNENLLEDIINETPWNK